MVQAADFPPEHVLTAVAGLPCAFGGSACRARLRSEPEEFQVDEVTLVEPDGKGEHVLLQIEKRDSNTDWVAGVLGRHAGVPRRDVSYAGRKDRHALTRQWFSVRLAGRPEPDWSMLDCAEIRVLQHVRHSRKLRVGALRGNRFFIRARELEGDRQLLTERLRQLSESGMPNYFGEQRFGHEKANLDGALAMFSGAAGNFSRQQRGLFLSAARAELFNQVLAARVATGTWNLALEGERLMLDGSRSSFLPDRIDAEIQQRLDLFDVHPSGPLWGRGELPVTGTVAEQERTVLAPLQALREGLERAGLPQERRALRARVSELDWSFTGNDLELSFFLPRGSYATALLRECLAYRTAL